MQGLDFFFFLVGLDLNLGLFTCQPGALPLEPHFSPFCSGYGDSLMNILSGCSPPDLSLPQVARITGVWALYQANVGSFYRDVTKAEAWNSDSWKLLLCLCLKREWGEVNAGVSPIEYTVEAGIPGREGPRGRDCDCGELFATRPGQTRREQKYPRSLLLTPSAAAAVFFDWIAN
jgi:hypothetical protein